MTSRLGGSLISLTGGPTESNLNLSEAPSSSESELNGDGFNLLEHNQTTSSMAAKTMRNELKARIQKESLKLEMDSFYSLFYPLSVRESKGREIIKSPKPEQIIPFKSLPEVKPDKSVDYLKKLAVLKLNGVSELQMGCVGPKSVIEVRDGMTFLDLTVRQIEYLNKEHGVNILTFNQSRFPRVSKESLLPLPKSHDADISNWYPPGHGDLFESLGNSGLLDKLLEQGKEYLFISNVDNLGATVDLGLLQHFATSGSEFIMEVTDKTKADIKGGTIIDYGGQVRLLEIAQVPAEHTDDFKSIKKFKIFNTNNLWVNIKAVKRLLDDSAFNMEIIVIQLETAVGAAIKHFTGAHGVNVPRSRFLPVKSTSDLFLITSDLYSLHHGQLIMNPKRQFGGSPVVKLGDHFKKLDHLTVSGDVTFGSEVVLRGTVIIVANHGARIDIPSGSILDDKVVSGNLRILDH
ncbi:UTP-glucose-1-phosphate uridylyltransferase [Chytridium lagenaria]|nr:UTP-glucose-1-phosphate uridylyltransferase [Chytridium lagenaria]